MERSNRASWVVGGQKAKQSQPTPKKPLGLAPTARSTGPLACPSSRESTLDALKA
jgi:hypothetical protein